MNILDAFVVTYALDASGFTKGEREVDEANERLDDGNKKTFDQMEERGKKAAVSFKNVRNEVIGLGLAFMGASTIGGLVSGMMGGAAAADRLGQTMGMSAKQIWAWRMAMKGVGGQTQEADAALQAVQNAKMGWTMRGDTGNNVAYSRLGVSGNDLQSKDPGAILQKIAAMQDKMDPQVYASLLQQIGLPASTIYFLQQGKDSVDKLLKANEANAKGQEELAKQTEQLQQSLATLQATIAGKLVPVLTTIANVLNTITGGGGLGGSPAAGDIHLAPSWMPQVVQDLFTVHRGKPGGRETAGAGPRNQGGAETSRAGPPGGRNATTVLNYLKSHGIAHETALGMTAAVVAEGGLRQRLGGGYKGRAIGIGQLLGKRRAAFLKKYGPNFTLQNELEFMLAELRGGDPGGQAVLAEKTAKGALHAAVTKFYRPASGYETQRDLAAGSVFIARNSPKAASQAGSVKKHQSYAKHRELASKGTRVSRPHVVHTGPVTNHYNIKSTDPKAAAREVASIQRRHAVAQADRGVAP